MKLQPTKVFEIVDERSAKFTFKEIINLYNTNPFIKCGFLKETNDKYLLSKDDLRNEKQKTLLAFIKWADARDEQGNKLDLIDTHNFLNQNLNQ